MTPYISTTFSHLGSSIIDVLKELKAVSISKVELGSIHCHQEALVDELKKMDFDYLSHNFFPPHKDPNFVVNIASEDRSIRSQSVDYLKENITYAAEINAELFTFHPGFLSDPKINLDTEESYDFQFSETNTARSKATELFWKSTEELLKHAEKLQVKIALETQGSQTQKDQVLFSSLEEIEKVFERFNSPWLGLNLNLAHFYLANQENFESSFERIKQLSARIFAMELSHTDGFTDSHSPLLEDEWYWPYIHDKDLRDIKKIIELRDQSIETIQDQLKLFSHKLDEALDAEHHVIALEHELNYHRTWLKQENGGARSQEEWFEINRAIFVALNETPEGQKNIVYQGFAQYASSSEDAWKAQFERDWQKPYAGKNVLDIGCGSRIRCEVFTDSRIHCIDPLLDQYANINNGLFNFPHLEKLVSTSAEERCLSLQNSQDLVFCWNMLDHVESWQKVLDNIVYYLKEGAHLILATDLTEDDEIHNTIEGGDEGLLNYCQQYLKLEHRLDHAVFNRDFVGIFKKC